MILHWSPRSPYVRKVMILAHETGLVDRIEKVRSATSMLKPNIELMRLNPWSKIPTLITDAGQVLLDSDVILEYLDAQHQGPKLHPAEPDQRWEALRWRAFGSEMMNATILWRNERERHDEKQLPQLLAAFEFKVHTGLEFLEREAEQLSSASFSVGHIAIGCALGYLEFRFQNFSWRESYPKLTQWHDKFKSRRSAQLTEPLDDLPRFNAAGQPK